MGFGGGLWVDSMGERVWVDDVMNIDGRWGGGVDIGIRRWI